MKELIVFALIGWMLSAMAATQSFGNRATAEVEPATQSETSGVDTEYQHGSWCIDGRSF
jgi:hypothetical protein